MLSIIFCSDFEHLQAKNSQLTKENENLQKQIQKIKLGLGNYHKVKVKIIILVVVVVVVIIIIIITTGSRNDSFSASTFFHQSGSNSDMSKSVNVLSSSKQKVQ